MNEERRAKFKKWFMNALLPAGAQDCTIRVVGTILHLGSLLESLMAPVTDPKLKTDGLKFWVDDPSRIWLSVRYQAHNEDYSKLLWPERFSKKLLQEIRRGFVEAGFPEGYAQEYLNKPIDDSMAYFRKEDLKPIEDPDEYVEYYAAADLAISEKDTRAYSAIVIAGLTRSGFIKIKDVRRFRGDALDIVNEIFSIQERYDPLLFAIESENISKAIGPFLFEEMGKPGRPYINLREMPIGNQDKIRRARSIQARTRAGKVQFDHDASWWPALQEELLYFPRGNYCDQVDALAWIGILLDKMVEVKTTREIVEEEYNREIEESYSPFDMGMDPDTGY
jgi:predicted phage terminase large subunit-like protein